ncbi:acyl-CoA thioesterase II [Myxococcota bacterium]|nr:acyl-CoA thioesterase II [Myxococcota bacterium]
MKTAQEILRELVELLALEKLEENLFRGQSRDLGWGQVYGGQVLGQALSAAVRTVPPERRVHSLHAYFLRPGDVKRPIVYDVDRIRDGGSFTSRRVRALQNGQAILSLAASFHADEPGFEHQDVMPAGPGPEDVPKDQERGARFADRLPPMLRDSVLRVGPFEMHTDDPEGDDPFSPAPRAPVRRVWLKTIDHLPDDPALHAYLLAYASDYAFLTTAMLPHGKSWLSPGMQVASLDHAIWFHHDFRVDDWLLHQMDSPAASGSRGLVRGRVFTRDGQLVASTAQEGLIRRKK